MTRSEQRRKLIKATNRDIADLTSFDRDYLIFYLVDKEILNKNQISKILGMTRERIGQIVDKEKFYQVVPAVD